MIKFANDRYHESINVLTIGYDLSHKPIVEAYLRDREQLAQEVKVKISTLQPKLPDLRARLCLEYK